MQPRKPSKEQPAFRRRVAIEHVQPQIDCGRFPIKRVVGDKVLVEADVFADGHEVVRAALKVRDPGGRVSELSMHYLDNDRWQTSFVVSDIGRYEYSVEGWIDRFSTWRRNVGKKVEAGQDVAVELEIGAKLIEEASRRAATPDAERLRGWAGRLRKHGREERDGVIQLGLSDELGDVMNRYCYPDRALSAASGTPLAVTVDPERARSSAWYEIFPRSCAPAKDGRQGTLRDCAERVPYVASMGFDVLYLPPIHPIGVTHRKGKNNSSWANANDVGSPWAIGSAAGGHTEIEPGLGTLEDFRYLLAECSEHGLEVALDLAFQCSPDHPYVKSHPNWFYQRPDGTIQYAENPPKKYEDIYPFDFDTEQPAELWQELKRITLYWIDQGVRTFRVDNPHTKPFVFWEWFIGEIRRDHPDVLFLSEAFTRPKVMYRLAKLGFTHSYTYFAWRNTKQELTAYLAELRHTEVREFFRPHFWPNTPDILTSVLQTGGRPAFMARLVLAATLSANYGIYGPAFELCVSRPLEAGREEYLNAEKYELKHWDLDRPDSLRPFIARVNQARREHPALQSDDNLQFHTVDNDQLIAYSKSTEDHTDTILVVVNLDSHWKQSGWIQLSLPSLGLEAWPSYRVRDLLTDAEYGWQGSRNYVELDPHTIPAHIFHVQR